MNGAAEADGGGYKRRYRALKRRLKLLLYEQECFQDELRRAQRKLLKVSRDKSYLLDRLLLYENVDEETTDSEATATSDSDGDGNKGSDSGKRKRSPSPPTPAFQAPPTPYMVTTPPFSPLPNELLAPPDGPRPPRPRPPGPARRSRSTNRRLQVPVAPPFPLPPAAPPPVPSSVPRRLLSRGGGGEGPGGEGSGDDALDGDDELVIDIPE